MFLSLFKPYQFDRLTLKVRNHIDMKLTTIICIIVLAVSCNSKSQTIVFNELKASYMNDDIIHFKLYNKTSRLYYFYTQLELLSIEDGISRFAFFDISNLNIYNVRVYTIKPNDSIELFIPARNINKNELNQTYKYLIAVKYGNKIDSLENTLLSKEFLLK